MSIVVAVRTSEDVVIAADTLGSFGDQQRMPSWNLRSRKVYPVGEAILGGTGWSLYDDILRDVLASGDPPVLDDEAAVFRFFMRLWKLLRKKYTLVNEQAHAKDSPFGDLDSSFLVVTPGAIHHVSSDMSVSRYECFGAIGSGSEYAWGALHAMRDQGLDAETMARRAVEAAMTFDAYCGGEIDLLRPGGIGS